MNFSKSRKASALIPMKLRMLARIIMILLLLAISNNTRLLGAADEQSKVKVALDNFFVAAEKQDWDKAGGMLTEDFEMFTDEVTILNKYEYIKVMKQENLHVAQMQLKDLRIEVSEQGQMAWCRYRGFFHMSAGPQSSLVETAETVVFRNENSGWKLVQAHASVKQRPWREGSHADSLLFREGSNVPKGN
jgi:ketosteroid isomerase-like protein